MTLPLHLTKLILENRAKERLTYLAQLYKNTPSAMRQWNLWLRVQSYLRILTIEEEARRYRAGFSVPADRTER